MKTANSHFNPIHNTCNSLDCHHRMCKYCINNINLFLTKKVLCPSHVRRA
ncbi:MAG TPA: hypothetical protein EYM79_11315 [Planctomycetes bacterium]|nr:hypothetical protein [Planctomycetaceae bacterium]HIN54892.1 hypothetical protein [Planctomycetota bacterium]